MVILWVDDCRKCGQNHSPFQECHPEDLKNNELKDEN
jgi:hypothetical protein